MCVLGVHARAGVWKSGYITSWCQFFLLLPGGFQGLNSGPQTWRCKSLSTEPSLRPPCLSLMSTRNYRCVLSHLDVTFSCGPENITLNEKVPGNQWLGSMEVGWGTILKYGLRYWTWALFGSKQSEEMK